MPTVEDAAREFRKPIVQNADGTVSVHLSGKRELFKWNEMTRASRRMSADISRESAARGAPSLVPMVGEGGIQKLVRPHRVKFEALRHGLKVKVSYRGGFHVERGPDGMLFRWIGDRWEPTGRVAAALTSDEVPCRGIQRDPDGRPWRGVRGRWVCMMEAARAG